jgi:hypothetical protein
VLEGAAREYVDSRGSKDLRQIVEPDAALHPQCRIDPSALRENAALNRTQPDENDHHQQRRPASFDVRARADRGSHRRHHPDRCRCRQPDDGTMGVQDRPRAEEADPTHDLRRDPRRVAVWPAVGREADLCDVDGQMCEQCRADADENVRAQSGRLAGDLALEPDRAAEDRREQQLEEQNEAKNVAQLREGALRERPRREPEKRWQRNGLAPARESTTAVMPLE